ncbi:MAG TPA: tetratricopeptide repeat protein [Candidatus Babeliales bacterium]|nr:tetratricopeptide repeat protein [Candidatus Babeliales bacterium]
MELSSYLSVDFWLTHGERYKNYLMAAGIALAIIIAGSFYWYTSYTRKQELAVSTLSDIFHDAARAQQNSELWAEVEMAARTGYKQFGSTKSAPYFLALQAESLLQMGRRDESLAMMEEVIKQLNSRSPLYYVYAIKQARMMLDTQDAKMQQNGLAKLELIAQAKDNKQADEALYYIGQYYAALGNSVSAKAAFEKVFEITKNQASDYPSPWVKLAQEAVQELA